MAKTQFFEDKTSVQSPKQGKADNHFFVDMVSKLGFKQHISLTQFYFVIGLIAVEKGHLDRKNVKSKGMKEVTKLDSFQKKAFYDNLVCNYLDVNEGVRDEFNAYQCLGLEFLREWEEEEGANCTNVLERFCSIWDKLGL